MDPDENLQQIAKTDGNRDAFETYLDSTQLSESLLKVLRVNPEPFQEYSTTKLASVPEISFQIEGTSQRTVFQGQAIITIGRKDPHNKIFPAFDLQVYKGASLGVSRRHAKISFYQECFYLMDLGSANGTRINEKKLLARQMTPIYDGDDLSFGNLKMSVSF